jgi:hypothetical protein
MRETAITPVSVTEVTNTKTVIGRRSADDTRLMTGSSACDSSTRVNGRTPSSPQREAGADKLNSNVYIG